MIKPLYRNMAYHNKKKKKTNDPLMTLKDIVRVSGVDRKTLLRYLPTPIERVKTIRGRKVTLTYWQKSDVECTLQHPKIRAEIERAAEKQRKNEMVRSLRPTLAAYTPENLIQSAGELRRAFVLHIGPTNSGKTHDAIEALMAAGNGTYLGPLRLLALEMYDRINANGIPCTLLTGEEHISQEGAEIISSTIEMCDFKRHFKVAVIDEAQLITDKDRGSSWLKALCRIDAEEIHVCLAPEAEELIEGLIREFGDPYNIVRHERLTPLVYSGRCNGYKGVQPNDAVICFSRKSVLSTAAQLEKQGFGCSVIYGALPPVARRNEVEKYTSGRSNVIVATDAIGLGISLPIRRIVFAETYKFDGVERRPLLPSEIRQIAGRAGRYGMFEKGEVLSMDATDLIERGLNTEPPREHALCIAFPRETLDSAYPVDVLLAAWNTLPPVRAFTREDMRDAAILYSHIGKTAASADRDLVYDLITCPVDTGCAELIRYWADCARAIIKGRFVPEPTFGTDDLLGCELQYKALDIHHQLLTRIGREDDCTEERDFICRRIKELMAEDKSEYIRRCSVCGRELPIGWPFTQCRSCRLSFRI